MFTITSTQDVTSLTLPLPLYESQKIASAQHEELGSFSVYAGLTKKYADDIKKYSLDLSDEALQKGTSDYQRFGKGDYKQRFKTKTRIQFILVHDETDEVASTIWYGPRELPEGLTFTNDTATDAQWYTMSFRTYGKYRGIRVTTAFSRYILDLYSQLHTDSPLWLGVQKDNEPGLRMYTKLGFTTIASDDAEGEFIMSLEGK